jgi:hypothetical protein
VAALLPPQVKRRQCLRGRRSDNDLEKAKVNRNKDIRFKT